MLSYGGSMLKFKNVIVGISGGVDSAVTALILKNKGYNVHGVFMQNWDIVDEQGFCSADEDYKDAQIVCDKLNVPLMRINFVKQYWNEVFCNLVKEYQSGFTPNPDILCNKYIKFNHFYRYAVDYLDADAIATGHYARTNFGPYLENYQSKKKVHLLRPKDAVKDQTFFLCQIEQEALQRTMFPLGMLNKSEVKQLAINHGFIEIAEKKESMGICFIGTRNFQNFISEYIDNKPGNFVDISTNKVVGEHKGIHQWTLGQRSRIPGVAKGYYIARKDLVNNIIYVAMGTEHPVLHTSIFFTSKPHWIHSRPPDLSKCGIFDCQFKFQHTHDLVDCEICESEKGLVIKLYKEKRALTPGQFAVFYKDDECLGSARITNLGPSNFVLYWLGNNGVPDVSSVLKKFTRNNSDSSDQCSQNFEFNDNISRVTSVENV